MKEFVIKKGQNTFYIGDGERPMAYISYRPVREGVIAVDHTVVDASLEGRGIGSKLFDTVLAFAKEEQLKIIPECSFVRAKFKRKPELINLLAEE